MLRRATALDLEDAERNRGRAAGNGCPRGGREARAAPARLSCPRQGYRGARSAHSRPPHRAPDRRSARPRVRGAPHKRQGGRLAGHEFAHAAAPHALPFGAQERDPVGARHRHVEDRLPDRAARSDGAVGDACAGARIAAAFSASAISARAGSRAARSSIMEEAEAAIRLAVDAAERMAGVQVESVIVNVHRRPHRLADSSMRRSPSPAAPSPKPTSIACSRPALRARSSRAGRCCIRCRPASRSATCATSAIRRAWSATNSASTCMSSSCDATAARNLMLAVERCHLSIEAMVATPYAAGLAALVDDEAELGAAVIDMGGGTTSVGVFAGGNLVHVDAVALGGNHVTMDIARGLTTRLADAERLKTLYGACIASPSDERETIAVPLGRRGRRASGSSAEIAARADHRAARRGDPRTGARPAEGRGLHAECRPRASFSPAAPASSPAWRKRRSAFWRARSASAGRSAFTACRNRRRARAFRAAVGLLIYPQVAGIEHFRPRRRESEAATGTHGYIARVGQWLRDSF